VASLPEVFLAVHPVLASHRQPLQSHNHLTTALVELQQMLNSPSGHHRYLPNFIQTGVIYHSSKNPLVRPQHHGGAHQQPLLEIPPGQANRQQCEGHLRQVDQHQLEVRPRTEVVNMVLTALDRFQLQHLQVHSPTLTSAVEEMPLLIPIGRPLQLWGG